MNSSGAIVLRSSLNNLRRPAASSPPSCHRRTTRSVDKSTRTISTGGQVLGPVKALNTKFPTKDRTFLKRETVECRDSTRKKCSARCVRSGVSSAATPGRYLCSGLSQARASPRSAGEGHVALKSREYGTLQRLVTADTAWDSVTRDSCVTTTRTCRIASGGDKQNEPTPTSPRRPWRGNFQFQPADAESR